MKSKMLLLSAFIAFILNLKAQTVSDFVSVPNPDDLEVDRFGNIWVNYRVSLSSSEHRLAKISPSGTITDIITENHTLGQFGVNDSIIWISGEWGASAYVYKYDHSGILLDSIFMPYPTAIILDPDGTWYVTQNAIGRLTKVNPNKTTQVLSSGSPLNHNLALARDESGMFYTCNLKNSKVIKINPNTGTKTLLTTLPTASPYSLGFLSYSKGNLFVPSFRHCIYKVDTFGSYFKVFAGIEMNAGDINGSIATALMNTPIATHPSVTGDTLYFTDSGNGKIKIIAGLNNTIGISNIPQNKIDFEIYPNPAIEMLFIKLKVKTESITKIEFITMEGKIIDIIHFMDAENLQQYSLSTKQLKKGNYVLKITTSNGEIISKKFIKL